MSLRLMMPHFDDGILDEIEKTREEAQRQCLEGLAKNIKEWRKCLTDGEKLYIAEVQASIMEKELTWRIDITYIPIYARNEAEALKFARERLGAEKFIYMRHLYEVNADAVVERR